jgi:hypothetical protein
MKRNKNNKDKRRKVVHSIDTREIQCILSKCHIKMAAPLDVCAPSNML